MILASLYLNCIFFLHFQLLHLSQRVSERPREKGSVIFQLVHLGWRRKISKPKENKWGNISQLAFTFTAFGCCWPLHWQFVAMNLTLAKFPGKLDISAGMRDAGAGVVGSTSAGSAARGGREERIGIAFFGNLSPGPSHGLQG